MNPKGLPISSFQTYIGGSLSANKENTRTRITNEFGRTSVWVRFSRRRHIVRNVCCLLIAGLAGGITYGCRNTLLAEAGGFLVINDALESSDVIYVLNGDPNARPLQAARLFKEKLAPRVFIARAASSPLNELHVMPNTTDMAVAAMERLGVPESGITVLQMAKGVRSTYDEAALLRVYMEQSHMRRAIIVTSAFHTRRARWIFRRLLPENHFKVMMSATPDPKYNEGNWWRSEDGIIACNNEYLKLAYYWVHYR